LTIVTALPLSCHCPALPCPALPCPALPCPALPCPALPCPALLLLGCPHTLWKKTEHQGKQLNCASHAKEAFAERN